MMKLNRARIDYEAGIRGLNPGELARAAGISEATLSRARAGRPLQARTLAALARALTQTRPLPNAENLVIRGNGTAEESDLPAMPKDDTNANAVPF